MSKRNIRRFAVVAGVAMAVGSMAPAMAAINLGGGAAADVDVDAFALLDGVTGSLPISALPAIPDLGDVTTLGLGSLSFLNGMLFTDVSGLLGSASLNVTNVAAGVTAPITANVANVTGTAAAVASSVDISGVTANVLGGGILSNNSVGGILNGGVLGTLPALPTLPGLGSLPTLPGLGMLTGLLGGGLVNVDLGATGSVNVLSALLTSL